ncbi:sugar ABC transporter substrate-binding protein [Nakamurella flavida]|uniref:Sugar ABC transporter substrate-binding protein n=1 Tax=Nakamurella flavida TaxID=363630 RepID=A0A938YP71_9ACTN|nr:sugar ABC transporter substrate-binding protein [Nakamurella flavida]MBM9476839.1 sugar ABC transporter substrate-binding protein [Nakamurella flavida]MDP9778719.1 multiple sugar transport system substrate-binding protein [Nakamurella flavida]
MKVWKRRRIAGAVAAVIATSMTLAACGGSTGGAAGSTSAPATAGSSGASGSASGGAGAAADQGVDDGTTLTLWTRAPLEKQAKALVEAYNGSHQNQVELTVVPNDDYVAKVGAAAGSGQLPDLFGADIVYVPNWASQGLYADLTDRIAGLPYADTLNKGHIDAGTVDGQKFVLPFVLDLSVMMYNKTLYSEAGLDPEKGPATLAEFADQATKIAALKKPGVSGTYFGGNCGGCLVFTWFPMVWASGEEVMNADGTESLLGGSAAQQVYSTYKTLNDDGVIGDGARDETGATWVAGFQSGNVGVMPYPATLLATASESVDVGVSALPGVDGGGSTFVGGDGLGISKDSKSGEQAWNFLAWLTSDAAQVDVLAKGGDVVSRSDLANNEYAAKDPRLVLINEIAGKGKTPVALNFQSAFNASDSPWLTLVRNAVYGGDSSVEADNTAITSVLAQQ